MGKIFFLCIECGPLGNASAEGLIDMNKSCAEVQLPVNSAELVPERNSWRKMSSFWLFQPQSVLSFSVLPSVPAINWDILRDMMVATGFRKGWEKYMEELFD